MNPDRGAVLPLADLRAIHAEACAQIDRATDPTRTPDEHRGDFDAIVAWIATVSDRSAEHDAIIREVVAAAYDAGLRDGSRR